MKRRMFLSSASTVGIVGAASGGVSIISSAFTSISKSVSLAEFSPITKKVLNKFVTELSTNFQELGLDVNLANRLAMPVRIISTDFKSQNHRVVYKSETENYISLEMKNGVQKIHISDKL